MKDPARPVIARLRRLGTAVVALTAAGERRVVRLAVKLGRKTGRRTLKLALAGSGLKTVRATRKVKVTKPPKRKRRPVVPLPGIPLPPAPALPIVNAG